MTLPLLSRRTLAAAAAVAMLALSGSGQALADNTCQGTKLDHALVSELQLRKPDGTPAETIPNADAAGSLAGLTVTNCNSHFFQVTYRNETRLVSRNDVAPAQDAIKSTGCKPDTRSFGSNGIVDCPKP